MARVVLLNKPYGVLSQFTGSPGVPTLAAYVNVPGVYPAGRLDADSEGLLVLTDDGALQARLADPRHKTWKAYWVQVEGIPDERALEQLRNGVRYADVVTAPARATSIPEPETLWPRDPPVRFRKAIPTAWIDLEIREGRNRQIRKMTAATGFPTLRLIRHRVGQWDLGTLAPGESQVVELPEIRSSGGRNDRTRSKAGPEN